MKFILAASMAASASALKTLTFEAPETSLHEIARTVNKLDAGWVADEKLIRFNTTDDAKQLCGTYLSDHPDYMKLPDVEDVLEDFTVLTDVPASFDSRTQWPKCSVIATIRDQSSCGSCWAFGSTESFEDRSCVSTGNDVEYSTEDTTSCCSGFLCGMSQGCNGGQPSAALDWMTRAGVVTGGDYDEVSTGKSCRPYTLAPCAHHVPPSAKYPACPSDEYPTPRCSKQCESGYSKSYSDDKTKGARAYSLGSVEKIMSDLVQNGPVAAAFSVYSDFPTYKSGVYKHTTGQMLGGHAIEIIGYGTENGEDYWLVKNSWNDQWGDAGTFKILKGTNECGIEDDVSAVSF